MVEYRTVRWYNKVLWGRCIDVSMKKWVVSQLNKEEASRLAETWGLPYFLAMILQICGITEKEEIETFLQPSGTIAPPLEFMDMQKAAGRVAEAIDRFEKICVYGDYDADGVTATALLFSYLESCGANVMYYIPNREGEGYGMNCAAVEYLHGQDVRLIVTVDNGIASLEEIRLANRLGMEVVVTDHHQPQEELPDAVAVVDPHRVDCPSRFKQLSGVGVAFKLIMALEGEDVDLQGLLDNYADLVAIGTIGDVVPLTGENRVFVKAGLRGLSHSDRAGLRALMEAAGMQGRKITSGSVSFGLVPRINAAGRLGSCDGAVRLLLSDYEEEAADFAVHINEENRNRQEIEADILREVEELFDREPQRRYDRVLVIEGEGWHHGVIGIVASRVVERYGKPCIIIGTQDGEARGSGRSIAGFSLYDAIFHCREYLTRFGGHPMAAGLSMEASKIPAFREAVNRYAAQLEGGMPTPVLNLDCKLNPSVLTVNLVEQLQALEPFGSGNPTPLFGLYRMTLTAVVPVGGGKHLRLSLHRAGSKLTAMRFSTTPAEFPYTPGDVLDLAVTLEKSEFRGETELAVYVRDIKLSDLPVEKLLEEKADYESIKRGESLPVQRIGSMTPNREEFAVVYRFLRAHKGWRFGLDILYSRLRDSRIGYGKLALILDIMEEMGLISRKMNEGQYNIDLLAVRGKVNLEDSHLLKELYERRKGGEQNA